jgi:hypothetical protein
VNAAFRSELLGLLGQFGIGEMLEAIRSGVNPDAASLTTVARGVSGLDDMSKRLKTALGGRADVLKAAAALEDLMERARRAGDSVLHNEAQNLLDLPEMFPLRLLRLSRMLVTGDVRPPKGLVEQAWIAVQTGLSATSRKQAAAEAMAWRSWSQVTDSQGQLFARVMVRAWQLAAGEESRSD